jgi:protein O-mannosyl-transferase
VTAALRGHAVALAVLVLAGAALYGRVLSYQFVHYDDHEFLVQHYGEVAQLANPARAVSTDAFAVIDPKARGVYFRPVLVWSYGLEALAFGPNPAVFHATNLALHVLVCTLAYALFVALGSGRALATGLALILLAHPCSALVAAWIPCRNESLLAAESIAATLALIAFARTGAALALAACVACYAAAVLTKESGAALLAVLAVAAALLRSGRPDQTRRLVAAGRAAIALTLVFAVLRHAVLGRSPLGLSQIPENLSGLVVYLGKILFPIGLSVVPDPADSPFWPGVAAALLLAAALAATRRDWAGPAGLGLAWFGSFLAPAALTPRETWGLEHRVYLPLVGLLLFAAQLAGRDPDPRAVRRNAALAFAVALAFAIPTSLRLHDFADPIAYWESAARTSPHSAFVASRLAWRYYDAGRLADVPGAATRALALDPASGEMYLARGVSYAKRGDLARAEPDLLRAVELEPGNADAWSNLARLQGLLGQSAQSAESQRRASELEARPKT